METDLDPISQRNTPQNKVAYHTVTQRDKQMGHFGNDILLNSNIFS